MLVDFLRVYACKTNGNLCVLTCWRQGALADISTKGTDHVSCNY